jgi:AcrR family transcriptional regulator
VTNERTLQDPESVRYRPVPGQSATETAAPSWAGRPPANDAEARQRIRDAARRCIDRHGINVRIAEVARELGVSRPTIYRHYSSGRAVLLAVAMESIEQLLARVTAMDANLPATPAEFVAEVACLLFDWLSWDTQLRQLTRFGAGAGTDDVTSSAALRLTRGLIERAGPSFDVAVDAEHLDEIAELVTRLVHSFVERPAVVSHGGGERCEFLRRWVTAAVGGILAGESRTDQRVERPRMKSTSHVMSETEFEDEVEAYGATQGRR